MEDLDALRSELMAAVAGAEDEQALEGVRDLVQGYNQMSRGLDALEKVAGEGYGPVERMQKLAEVLYLEMGKLKGFVETK